MGDEKKIDLALDDLFGECGWADRDGQMSLLKEWFGKRWDKIKKKV